MRPPRHLIAAAEITPSGVPPIPQSRSMPVLAHDGEQRRGDVAVGDEADAGADLADLGDRLLVTRAVEHDHGDVAGLAALALGDPADHVARAARRG